MSLIHILWPLNPEPTHWIHNAWEAAGAILLDPNGEISPMTLLIGAGGSGSSGGPSTERILERCKEHRKDVFPTNRRVYEQFSELTVRERDQLTRPLFEGMKPYVGYRCLAAMAKSRPIFVVNLNWDGCIKAACDLADVPCEVFDLDEVDRGRRLVKRAIDQGFGIVCAHVHGYLEDKRKGTRGIRLSHQDTISFEDEVRELLVDLFSYPTIVAGTSLVGHQDVHQLLDALAGDAKVERKKTGKAEPTRNRKAQEDPEPLWVFERGDPSRIPRFGSRSAKGLSKALIARDSLHNFVSNTDVDFDALLTTLRAREAGYSWKDVCDSWENLRRIEEIIPPNPRMVMPLLDGDRTLIIGAPHVGSTTLAFLVAWWRCLIDADNPGRRIKAFRGAGPTLDALRRDFASFVRVGAVIIDELLDDDDEDVEGVAVRDRLAEELIRLACPVFATTYPDAALRAACKRQERLPEDFTHAVVSSKSLWRSEDLRAWAKARGGEKAEIVCREVRMGLISTPSQTIRRLDDQIPHEQGPQWRERLRRHLDQVYRLAGGHHALILAMVRLQDFSTPKSACSLDRVAGAATAERLIEDPWNICMSIEVDEPYLRLSSPCVARVVDDWIASNKRTLRGRLAKIGWSGRWAVDALEHWEAFREIAETRVIPSEAPGFELFGTECFRRALQDRDLDLALDALWGLWQPEADHWTAKDVALDLVVEWETLKEHPRARALRDSLLLADKQMGAYALFEAMMRVGRPVSLDLWAHGVARLLDLAASLHEEDLSEEDRRRARRQIGLSVDALLWRPCPAGQEQERKLVKAFLAAADADPALKAIVAAACAYHWQGAERLRKAGFELSLAVPSDPDLVAALEMAWLVEWHFAHQSRCRAATSRRTFLSTIDGSSSAEPRYLDRVDRRDGLGSQQQAAIIRYLDALLRRPETAEWGLHLVMNIQTTTGFFRLSDSHIAKLREALQGAPLGEGVVSAALTYKPVPQVHELLSGVFDQEDAKRALRERIGTGVKIGQTKIVEPRFSMWADPWVIRDRWRLTKSLPLGMSGPQELIEELALRVDDAVEAGLVRRDQAERAISAMWLGDLRGVEGFRRNRSSPHIDPFLQLLVVVTKYHSASDNGN